MAEKVPSPSDPTLNFPWSASIITPLCLRSISFRQLFSQNQVHLDFWCLRKASVYRLSLNLIQLERQWRTLVNVASHWGHALETYITISSGAGSSNSRDTQAGHGMKFRRSLMPFEISLSRKDFVASIDLARPRAYLWFLLTNCLFLRRFCLFLMLVAAQMSAWVYAGSPVAHR